MRKRLYQQDQNLEVIMMIELIIKERSSWNRIKEKGPLAVDCLIPTSDAVN